MKPTQGKLWRFTSATCWPDRNHYACALGWHYGFTWGAWLEPLTFDVPGPATGQWRRQIGWLLGIVRTGRILPGHEETVNPHREQTVWVLTIG